MARKKHYIEEEVIKHDKNYFTRAHSTKAHRDKIHHRFPNNEVRDRMLTGEISVEECDEKEVHDFLSLLKKGDDRNNETRLG